MKNSFRWNTLDETLLLWIEFYQCQFNRSGYLCYMAYLIALNEWNELEVKNYMCPTSSYPLSLLILSKTHWTIAMIDSLSVLCHLPMQPFMPNQSNVKHHLLIAEVNQRSQSSPSGLSPKEQSCTGSEDCPTRSLQRCYWRWRFNRIRSACKHPRLLQVSLVQIP